MEEDAILCTCRVALATQARPPMGGSLSLYVQTPMCRHLHTYVQTPTFLSVNKRRPLEFPSLN